MKQLFLILFTCLGISVYANMASPIVPGTMSGSPFTSANVLILGEKIYIKPGPGFLSAEFIIEYRIKVEKEGVKIPLLFYALDYDGNFKVLFNGQEIEPGTIPEDYIAMSGSFINDFDYFYHDSVMGRIEVEVEQSPGSGIMVDLRDLKYFETDMPVGEHLIKVSYVANYWTDKSDWINKYSFHYALSPAKYWKSFGQLEIVLDASDLSKGIHTNLGSPTSGSLDSVAVWKFDKLPVEIFEIVWTPQIKPFAGIMLNLGPGWLSVIFTGILLILHLWGIFSYRRANRNVQFSWIMITGSIFVPLFALLSYILFFGLIDSLIGEHASGRHGYTFLIVFLYPLVTPVYWIIMWLVDRIYRRKFLMNSKR